MKNTEYKYVQVCCHLSNTAMIEKEFGAYDAVQDNYPKYVISLDRENFSRDGIQHINAIQFLMGKKI